MKTDRVEMSYGQCLDSVVTHASFATDLLDTPSVDPSPPLPWYDRARQVSGRKEVIEIRPDLSIIHTTKIRHGDFDMESKEFIVNVMTSPDPEDDLEFMEAKFLAMRGELGVITFHSSDFVFILHLPKAGGDIVE